MVSNRKPAVPAAPAAPVQLSRPPRPAEPTGAHEGHGHEGHGHEGHGHEGHGHEGHGHAGHEYGHEGHEGSFGRSAWWGRVSREVMAVGVSGVALALGFAAEYLGSPATLTVGLFLVAIVAGATEIVPRGMRGVFRDRSLDINFLITLAVAGAMLLGEWSEGATVVFLFAFGEALESYTLARTRRSIQALMAIAPETAQVKDGSGDERTVRVEAVPVGATVVVRPGDRVPLDGVIALGESSLDQAAITGESLPVDKVAGEAVFGGTINGSGYLEVRTTKPFAENTLSRIIHLVETAQSEKAPSQRLVERFARVYTPVVVVAAVVMAVVPPLLFGEPFLPWFNRALVMLLIACPCALVIATPVTVVAAIGNASRHGVLIKGGAYLERAGSLRAVAFDKTGTLTWGVPEVSRIVPLNGVVEADLLRLAAAVEARSEHPLAGAIVRAGQRAGLRQLPAVERFQAAAGNGVRATVEGTPVLIGKPAWLEGFGVDLAAARPALAALAGAGQSAVVVARAAPLSLRFVSQAGPCALSLPRYLGGAISGLSALGDRGGAAGQPEVLGTIGLADRLRDTAAPTVAALRASGVQRIVLLSGDNEATASAVAARVGIGPEDVFSELLPEDKVTAVKALVREHRQVAMVGDGVNDAPALAVATVGIAMGAGGSDTALETADVALVGDDLTRLPWVLQLSRRAARTIKVNIALALLTKLAVIVLAVFGLANLWLAIATDTGATVLVILNGMRLLGGGDTGATGEPGDVAAARRRYGLGQEDPHAGHAH